MSSVLVLIAVWLSAGALMAQATIRVSVDSQGNQANGDSFAAATISADGRFVAFGSDASNLVPGDTNGRRDILVRDTLTGTTTRASVDSQGGEANGDSDWAAISGNGRFVTFHSWAENLVPGDTNGLPDIFVHDTLTGATTRVNVSSQGAQANSYSFNATISANGRFVTFESEADNLVPGDTNQTVDVFVHDAESGTTTRASVDSQGAQANAGGNGPIISADGRFVSFASPSTNLVPGDTNDAYDVFVHDQATGATTRVSVDSQGGQANADSFGLATMSADGRWVAFGSRASNLVLGDQNGVDDIFVHDRATGATTRVSVGSQGSEANGDSEWAAISGNGRFVAFTSGANNFVPDTNGSDVFVHDQETGATTRASVSYQGAQANGDASLYAPPSISADGRFVAFYAWASNLVADDTNQVHDVFVHDRDAGPCSFPASSSSYGSGWPGTSGIPGLVAHSDPVLCATLEVFADNSYGSDTTGVVFAGLYSTSIVTAFGGTILVWPSLATPVSVPAAGLALTAPIPCDDLLCGISLFAQAVEIDPGASRGVSFTPGLELRLGVR